MPGWQAVLLWWVAFAGAHLVLSSLRVRSALIGRLGDRPFQGLYSLAVLAIFVPLVVAYSANTHGGPLLWNLRELPILRELSIGLTVLGFAFIVAAFFQPSPVSMIPGATPGARGLLRITRHPLFTGISLWALAHLLMNGWASDVVFFGGFAVFAFVGSAHQDARKRATEGERLAGFYGQTSQLAFGAILTGRNRLVWSEIPWVGAAIGAALGVLLFVFHGPLFGP